MAVLARRAWLLAASIALLAPSALAQEDAPRERYFYKGYDYGTQSLFSPLWVFLSRGYDVFQLHPTERNPFKFDYATNVSNVVNNVVNPIGPVTREGWGRWLHEEIFPLCYTADCARWVPNYTLHLIGGGMSYREMREWGEDHGMSTEESTALSIVTLYAAAFVNEAIENHGTIGDNTDCIADLFVFDSLGIVLYSFDGAAKFFSTYFIVDDWSWQPSFVLPTGDLHNVGNYYAAKVPIPWYPRLRIFAYGGVSSLGGLSYKVDGEYSISAAAGGRVDTFTNSTIGSVFNVVSLRPAGAIFVDRNESLLFSMQVAATQYYRVDANLYPNAFFHMDPGIGLWTAVNADGSFLVGLSVTRALGLGLGAGTMK